MEDEQRCYLPGCPHGAECVHAKPAAVERQPLTDEQIEALAKPFIVKCGGHWNNCEAIEDNGDIEEFARAIELAHGITE